MPTRSLKSKEQPTYFVLIVQALTRHFPRLPYAVPTAEQVGKIKQYTSLQTDI